VKVTLTEGAYHDVDSSVLAFEIAGRAGFNEALRKAAPKILEPIIRLKLSRQKTTWATSSAISTPVVGRSRALKAVVLSRS
jgi:hypothetical protein